jgi:hypothetical protein
VRADGSTDDREGAENSRGTQIKALRIYH